MKDFKEACFRKLLRYPYASRFTDRNTLARNILHRSISLFLLHNIRKTYPPFRLYCFVDATYPQTKTYSRIPF